MFDAIITPTRHVYCVLSKHIVLLVLFSNTKRTPQRSTKKTPYKRRYFVGCNNYPSRGQKAVSVAKNRPPHIYFIY